MQGTLFGSLSWAKKFRLGAAGRELGSILGSNLGVVLGMDWSRRAQKQGDLSKGYGIDLGSG